MPSVDEIGVQAIDLAVPLHIPGLARWEATSIPTSVSDPYTNRRQDPDPYLFDIRIRIQQVKFGYKDSLFVQSFHDFHLIKIYYA